jgi:hypothetical protein
LSPSIDIEKHIHSGLDIRPDTLRGIAFVAKDPEKLKRELRNAKDVDGLTAFAWGHKEDKSHWPLAKSFSETHGIGFREIWRPRLSRTTLAEDFKPRFRPRWKDEANAPIDPAGRLPELQTPQWDTKWSARFGDSITMPNMSSLHCAVAPDICDIHIDEMGFVVEGLDRELALTPDFIRHIIVELWWKTNARKVLPDGLVDRLTFVIPSSLNDYSLFGISLEEQLSRNIKVSLSWTVPLKGDFEYALTLTIGGRHGILGSK